MKTRGFTAGLRAVVVAASLTLAGHASATVHLLTYQGVVTSALDSTGEFGVGANLIGKSFTAHVTYDDAKPGTTYSGGVYYDDYHGDGAASPVTATIMLNGFTRSFGVSGGYDNRLDRNLQPNCLFDCTDVSFQQHAEDRYTENGLYTLNYINLGGINSNGLLSGIAHTAPHYTSPPIELYAFVNLFQQDIYTLNILHDASVGVSIASITEGVPEPGVWALMLMGFGTVGAALRVRRRGVLAQA